MKNLLKVALLFIMIAVAQPSQSKALTGKSETTNTLDAMESQRLVNRLEEIKSMDKSSMTRSEKRSLRHEVKSIEKKMDSNGGVYLSAGAVILIIILLIILL